MKRIGWVGALLVLLINHRANGERATIAWQQSLEVAKVTAAGSNRLVWIHFWAPWCQPCQRLEQDVFSDRTVQTIITANFVPVKLNVDHFAELARHYDISGLPADVILEANGTVLAKLTSPPTAKTFVEQMTLFTSRPQPSPPNLLSQSNRFAADSAYQNSPPTWQPNPTVSPHFTPLQQHPTSLDRPVTERPKTDQQALETATASAAPLSTTPTTIPGASSSSTSRQPDSHSRPWPVPSTPDTLNTRLTSHGTSTREPMFGHDESRSHTVQLPDNSQKSVFSPPVRAKQQKTEIPSHASGLAYRASKGNPPLGLDGFCPVTLKEHKRWKIGDRRWGVIHRGRTYLFASSAEQQRFLAEPDIFSPALSGIDSVLAFDQGQSIPGHREHGVYFDGRVYLFASEKSLQQFSQNPQHYAVQARQALK